MSAGQVRFLNRLVLVLESASLVSEGWVAGCMACTVTRCIPGIFFVLFGFGASQHGVQGLRLGAIEVPTRCMPVGAQNGKTKRSNYVYKLDT